MNDMEEALKIFLIGASSMFAVAIFFSVICPGGVLYKCGCRISIDGDGTGGSHGHGADTADGSGGGDGADTADGSGGGHRSEERRVGKECSS